MVAAGLGSLHVAPCCYGLDSSSGIAAFWRPCHYQRFFRVAGSPLTIVTAPNTFPGWSVVTGDTAIYATGGSYSAAAGNQFLFLPAGSIQDAEIDQQLTGLVPGVDYEISYVICGYNAQVSTKDCSIEIAAFNQKQDTYDLTVPAQTTTIGSVANPWLRHSFTFPAEAASTVLSIDVFRTNAVTDATAAFDNFSIRIVPKGQPTVTLLGKKPRKPLTKKIYTLRGTCSAVLPLQSITVIAGKSKSTLTGAGSFSTKVRLKKRRTRITVTTTDIAGTTSPAATRVVAYNK